MTMNLSQTALLNLRRLAYRRNISPTLLPQDNLVRLIELAAQYTKKSDAALIYLELPLESPAPLDVQFCLTECLRVPDMPELDLSPHKKLLAYASTTGEKVGADFAFDAAGDYVAAPCLYGYMPHYEPELVEHFFAAVGASAYGRLCRDIVTRAPAYYNPYYIGLMQSRKPAYARLGFGHAQAEERYRNNIADFVQDLQSLGYDKPVSTKMQQELAEAAQYDYLQNTQLSFCADGTFADRLAMDGVYNYKAGSYPALNLLKNPVARDHIAAELAKCRFAVHCHGNDALGRRRNVILRSFIQYIKCTWINGEKGPLKAYLALSAQVC